MPFNTPSDCQFDSDGDYYQHSGPVLPICDVCGFDIPRDSGHGCCEPGCQRMICNKHEPEQHAGPDFVYCDHHIHAALRQYAADLERERDTLAASLILTVALGSIGPAIEGLVATNVKVTCVDALKASIVVEKYKKNRAA